MSQEKIRPLLSTEQERASFAFECAQKGADIEKKKEYKSYVKKVPMLIKTNGLGATLAFLAAKADNKPEKAGYAYLLISSQLAKWLKKQDYLKIVEEKGVENNLAKAVIELPSPVYRAITQEVLAFLNWLRRYTEALIEGDE